MAQRKKLEKYKADQTVSLTGSMFYGSLLAYALIVGTLLLAIFLN